MENNFLYQDGLEPEERQILEDEIYRIQRVGASYNSMNLSDEEMHDMLKIQEQEGFYRKRLRVSHGRRRCDCLSADKSFWLKKDREKEKDKDGSKHD